jgi:ADP-heptose:LPS heptosyltransferase
MRRQTLARESFVVLRLSSVGDVVLTEPVVAALSEARRDADIGFVVKERFRDLVAGNPAITRVHTLREGERGALLALSREIRKTRYSVVIDLHANLRSRFLADSSGAALVLRYRKRDIADTARVRLLRRPFRAKKTIVGRYLESLAPLGIRAQYRAPRFHLAPADAEWAGDYLARSGLAPRGYAAMAPGSVWATKLWPADRYGAVAARLSSELGLRTLVLGTAAERGSLIEVAARVPGAVVAAGETRLGQMAGLMATARVYIGNDSGPTHMAMALGVPTVAVFGPTDPGQFEFRGARLLFADLPCSACSFFGSSRCRLGHLACMTGISVEQVFAAAKDLSAGGEGP